MKEENKTTDLKSFHYLENGEIMTSTLSTTKSQSFLDAGHYTLEAIYSGGYTKILFSKLEDEEKIEYRESVEHTILDPAFEAFFNKSVKRKMKQVGICHKLGILLYGKEGTGKTSLVKHYCKKFARDQDAIVIMMLSHGSYFIDTFNFVKQIRAIQSNPIILVIEELETYLGNNQHELNLITDGIRSIENCIMFATTNYIETIPDALKARKSRFKYALEVKGVNDVGIITDLCTNLIGDILPKEKVKVLSQKLKGSTLDEIKQECIDIIMNIASYKPVEKRKIGFVMQQQDE